MTSVQALYGCLRRQSDNRLRWAKELLIHRVVHSRRQKGWQELGSALAALPEQGWEPFMAVPIISVSAYFPGISGSRTTTIIHYFRRQRFEFIVGETRVQTSFTLGLDSARELFQFGVW